MDSNDTIRLSSFAIVFAAMSLWEWLAPRRAVRISRQVRWLNNLALVALNTLLVRVLFPLLPVGLAILAQQRGWGLFNVLQLPSWTVWLVSLLIFDLAIYLQHVMFHAIPALWRLHRVHHADLEFDVTTGLRFHPLEILLSTGFKLAVVAVVGPPAVVVVAFEVLLNATSMFNHGNVRIPLGVDRMLRGVVVTPDMHRVHHSIDPRETNSNFGFNLAWWDRMLGTYRAQPRAGHDMMTIGIERFRTPRDLWLDRMLIQPALGPASGHSLERNGG
jgi:sterol desaturase/sphingolipid hydroxylase (fatty acid hydroxylase superfamily)